MVTFTAIGKVLEPVDWPSELAIPLTIPLPVSPDEDEASFARPESAAVLREAGLVATVVSLHLDLGSNPCMGKLAIPKILSGLDALVLTDRA